jgi:hypothetical protein
MKNLIRTAFIFLSVISFLGCSNDDETITPVDHRSFTTNETTDFFINKDGTVNISVSATIQNDINFGDVINRGFVYGNSSEPEVNSNNISYAVGEFDSILGYIDGLASGHTYFIRGYFEYSDGTFFYGNEIQASTDVNAVASRGVNLAIESDAFLIQTNFITVTLNINNVIKEMPVEVGIEYSVNNDFTNSSINKVEGFNGVHNKGVILITSYSAVAEPLTSSTQYYFRPYVKYADNILTNGGTSKVSFTTN